MKEIEQEYKSIGFDLNLPDNSGNNEYDKNDNRFIPRSHIAQQLEEKLVLAINWNRNAKENDYNNNNHNNNDGANWKMNKKIRYEIIDTFRQLYHKYVDSRRAVFMINVSSGNRDNIMKLFDTIL